MTQPRSGQVGRLHGQVVLITGAGSGIGRGAALAFAREGCRTALLGRRAQALDQVADEIREGGGTCLPVPADVADAHAVAAAVARVQAEWGRVDVLVNSAGVNVARRDMERVSDEDWTRVLAVNLTGTFLVTRAVLPGMRAQGSGTVINVSSTSGCRASTLTGPAYDAAKAGVNAFTESLNLYERRHGIRASAVCPGEVATPLLEQRPTPPSAEARQAMLQPEDVAEVLLLIASLPQRATVELVVMQPTLRRDWSGELA